MASPAIEIVREHVDLDVKPDGSFMQVNDVAYRILDQQGLQAMQHTELSFTDGYQYLSVAGAYTLKADGRRVPVDRNTGILYGHGATTQPGFEDVKTLTVFFPDLEVGDQVVLQTVFQQKKPWFANQFTFRFDLSRTFVSHDVRVTLSAPNPPYRLYMDSAGSADSHRTTAAGQYLQSWTFANAKAEVPEAFQVLDPNTRAHVALSTFGGYRDVAKVYAGTLSGKSEVTPEIQALADTLTHGISTRREQAHAIYDWVATHISYVSLVLGAGGFIPHEAATVLATKYGDCKDHVMILEALLKAKGIDSSPVLINAGSVYKLPTTASPFVFNHLITYIPEFKLFVDSTARFAPFGILPDTDAGKPVVLVRTGESMTTPALTPEANDISVVQKMRVAKDGSAEGDSTITVQGAAAIAIRTALSSLQPSSENDYFRATLGPGATGSLERGDITNLTPDYTFSAHYKIPGYINIPGPGALPAGTGYKPFSFTGLLGGLLTDHRTQPYACQSASAHDDSVITLPAEVEVAALPRSLDETANGAHLTDRFEQLSGNRVHEQTDLRVEHPNPLCSAEDYNNAQPQTMKMISALKSQVLFR